MIYLKGQSREIFYPLFFCKQYLWVPRFISLSHFEYKFVFVEIFDFQIRLRAMPHSAESFLVLAIQIFFLLFCRQYEGKFTNR
jgi:hypothetical protein